MISPVELTLSLGVSLIEINFSQVEGLFHNLPTALEKKTSLLVENQILDSKAMLSMKQRALRSTKFFFTEKMRAVAKPKAIVKVRVTLSPAKLWSQNVGKG